MRLTASNFCPAGAGGKRSKLLYSTAVHAVSAYGAGCRRWVLLHTGKSPDSWLTPALVQPAKRQPVLVRSPSTRSARRCARPRKLGAAVCSAPHSNRSAQCAGMQSPRLANCCRQPTRKDCIPDAQSGAQGLAWHNMARCGMTAAI